MKMEYERVKKEALLTDGDNALASPLWRPLHDILIDWNEGRMKIERSGIRGTVSNMAKGENNIKAVKTMIEVVAQAQLDKLLKDKRVRIEAENQDLPECNIVEFIDFDKHTFKYRDQPLQAYCPLLTPKDGYVWVKCKVKEE